MKYSKQQLWDRFKNRYTEFPSLGLAVDLSRMDFADDFLVRMEPRMQKAFADMAALEKGAIANPDENRMVGHYWLRNPALAPTPQIQDEIQKTLTQIKAFAGRVHSGQVRGKAGPFKNYLLIGIGGSALGPQFVSSAIGDCVNDKLTPYFLDNTDPDGIKRVLDAIGPDLAKTLSVVISKSGGTKETRNGMLEAKAAYEAAGLDFGKHAVAITQEGSELDKVAVKEGWIERFPMWDWVGGRTSELSAVGLLPAALQGINVDEMLAGAKACDEATRTTQISTNPAAQLALAWFHGCGGNGSKNMVVIPYKDRLELFSKYLQQLIMESLGKELDVSGKVVNQGLAVFGNKGSTDQHSYVQQLRDGVHNFFLTFIEILQDQEGKPLMVEPQITSGDYLQGFYLGTRQALFEKGRESITITVKQVSPFIIGLLIALFERTVGLYAALVNVNAYHQPGVEAGKKAATAVLDLQKKVLAHLAGAKGNAMTAEEIASGIAVKDDVEHVFKICEHLAANPSRGLAKMPGKSPTEAKYRMA